MGLETNGLLRPLLATKGLLRRQGACKSVADMLQRRFKPLQMIRASLFRLLEQLRMYDGLRQLPRLPSDNQVQRAERQWQ